MAVNCVEVTISVPSRFNKDTQLLQECLVTILVWEAVILTQTWHLLIVNHIHTQGYSQLSGKGLSKARKALQSLINKRCSQYLEWSVPLYIATNWFQISLWSIAPVGLSSGRSGRSGHLWLPGHTHTPSPLPTSSLSSFCVLICPVFLKTMCINLLHLLISLHYIRMLSVYFATLAIRNDVQSTAEITMPIWSWSSSNTLRKMRDSKLRDISDLGLSQLMG